jgi:hypothetical protein
MKVRKTFRNIAQYVPQVLLLLSILISNVFFPALAIAEEVNDLQSTNTQVEDIPIDDSEDILEDGISTSIYEEVVEEEQEADEPLFVYKDGIYEVFSVVEGEEYVYPDNEDVRIRFTRVIEDGNLVIKRVELSDEDRELLNTSDNYGWDISSTMSNGSFTYDLTLPNTQGNDVEVKYTEDGSNYESIDSNVEVNEGVIYIEGLEHFTVFVVTNDSTPLSSTSNPTCVEAGASSNSDCYNSIQDAINVADPEDIIEVYPGTYDETIVINDNNITLQGVGETKPQIKRNNATASTKRLVDIRGSNVTFENFEIVGLDKTYVGISISGQDALVQDVDLSNVLTGIQTTTANTIGSSDIFSNTVINTKVGISLQNDENEIKDNLLTNISLEGMGVINAGNSDIHDNTFDINATGVNLKDYSSNPSTFVDFKNIVNNNSFARLTTRNDSFGNVLGNTLYVNIQDAIEDAESGDVINVGAGTYVEDGQIVIDKDLTIIGEGKTKTILKPNYTSTGIYTEGAGWFYIKSGISATIKNLTLDGEGQIINTAIQSRGNVVVENCLIKNIYEKQYFGFGIQLLDGTNNTIINSEFENIERVGIHVRGGKNGVTDVIATITDCIYTGRGEGDYLEYGIEFGGGGSGTVDNFTVLDVLGEDSGWDSAGILATTLYGEGTSVNIKNSTFSNNLVGIIVGYNDSDTTTLIATKNAFVGNLQYGIRAKAQVTATAEENWWGSQDGPSGEGPGSGDAVSTNVDYCPWLDAVDGDPVGPCLGEIQGRKYEDLNQNTLMDNGEPGIKDWTINLYDNTWNLIDSMMTGDDSAVRGNVDNDQYRFEDLLLGSYYICEARDLSYYQTGPLVGDNPRTNSGTIAHTDAVGILNQSSNTITEGETCWQVEITGDDLVGYIKFGNSELEAPTKPIQVEYKDEIGNVYSCVADYTNQAKISIHWTDVSSGITPPDNLLKYQRQYSRDGNNWSGNEIYTNNYTNFRSFGYGEVTHYSKVRSFYDTNLNDQYDTGEPVSEWSNICGITYDATNPTGEILGIRYPTKDVEGFITNDNTPLIYGNMDDNSGIKFVDVTIDGSPGLVGSGGPTFWETGGFPTLIDGVHPIQAIIEDKAGNTTTLRQQLTIDTIAPNAIYTHYKDGVEIVDPIAFVKSLSQLSFTAKYEDTLPSSGLYQDSFVIFEAQDDGTFSFSSNGKKAYCTWRTKPNLVTSLTGSTYDLTDKVQFTNCINELPDGEYYMAHQIYDNATRQDIPTINQFRDVLGLHFVVDTTNPSQPIITNSPNNSFTNTNWINVEWIDRDDQGTNPSGIKGYILRYEFSPANGGSVINWSTGLREVGNPKTHSGSYGHGEGTYVIYVKTIDNSGNESPESEPFTITYDITNPTIPTNPDFKTTEGEVLGCESITNNYTIVATWSPSSDASPITYEYQSYNPTTGWIWNGGDIGDVTERQGSFTVGEGTYGFAIRAVDAAGNSSDWTSEDLSESCQITYDETPPTIGDHPDMILTEGDLFPTDTVQLTDNIKLNEVCAEATDLNPSGIGSSGEICVLVGPSNLTGDQFALADEIRKVIEDWQGNPFTTIDLNILPEGQYEITYHATDKAGNISDVQTFTVTINDNIPTVEITADDTEITQGDTDIVLGTNITNGNPPFTYLWSGACTGTEPTTTFAGNNNPDEYTCTVTVTDADGDTAQEDITIIVNAIPEAQNTAETLGATTTTTRTSTPYTYATINEDNGTGAGEEIIELETTEEEEEVLGETCDTPITVKGYIYLDKNKNEERNENEEGIQGITITILTTDEEGNTVTIDTLETDENGYWETKLCSGKYTMEIDQENLPKNVETSETIELQVEDNLTEPMEFNIPATDTRNFWQKNWYWILITTAVVITIGYMAVKNNKEEITQ